MIKKKICLLGSFAVGKTSLINQFVNQSFSEKYHTTIGVKIDQKNIQLGDQDLTLIIWDIHGEDRFQHVQSSYVLGSAGYFLVVDATRKESLGVLKELKKLIENTAGILPYKVLINKSDLKDQIEVVEDDLIQLGYSQDDIIVTSAKTGDGVEDAFLDLGKTMLKM